jgi:DNA-binding transcriptional LysR family regulator
VSGSDETTMARRDTLADRVAVVTKDSALSEQWIGLELRHLAALQAIAEEGSFKSAAAKLGYTPSAISQQIATLERIVGAKVIVREQGKAALGLTGEGKVLLAHMTAIEARLSAARTDLEAMNRGLAGTLRVGVWESVGARLLPELVVQLRSALPDVRLELCDAADDLVLLRSLERGLLDVVFAVVPLAPGPFQSRVVLRDPWLLVSKAGSEQEKAARATAASMTSGVLPLLCFRSTRALEPVIRHLRREGAKLDIVLRCDYNSVLLELAAAGLGVALLPRLAVDLHDARISVVGVGSLVPPRHIAVAWHADRTDNEAIERFVALAADVGASLGDPPPEVTWRSVAAV